ncbi:MAG: M42 family peptidase, partial [Gemmatimonadetes bacterium]|nr:M42 family peptidase [Gemmatimonadota bacterium]
MSQDISFLERLLDAPGPSGFEERVAKVWSEEAGAFSTVWSDVVGNSFAAVGKDRRPLVLMAGHVDEIGVQVTHLDEKGLVYFGTVGGWDPQVLVGQRIRLLTRAGDRVGVVGRKAIHLIDPKDRDKAVKVKELWMDLGASSREELAEMGVRVGDPGVLEQPALKLPGGRIA